VLVGDETTARTLDRNFDADLDRCIAIDRTSRARRGILQRLFERLFYTFQDSPARWVLADSATVGHGGDADRVLARTGRAAGFLILMTMYSLTPSCNLGGRSPFVCHPVLPFLSKYSVSLMDTGLPSMNGGNSAAGPPWRNRYSDAMARARRSTV